MIRRTGNLTEGVADATIHELLAKFMASEGLPAETIRNPSLQQLIRRLNPEFLIPSTSQIQENTNIMSDRMDALVSPGMKEVTITFDVFGSEDDDTYLVFSVHFFHGPDARKNMVYFRRMEHNEISARLIFDNMRTAIYKDHHTYPKMANIVIPNERMISHFSMDNSISNHFVCFNHLINVFANDILRMEELSGNVEKLRTFVRKLRNNEHLFENFKGMQKAKKVGYKLPNTATNKEWQATAEFLNKCISLYDTFANLEKQFSHGTIFSHDSFMQLVFFNRIFQQCIKYSHDLSGPTSCISQVMPAISSMKVYISTNTMGHSFEKRVRTAFTTVFQKITTGELRRIYDTSSLLDPRYGYREDLYTESYWTEIENELVENILSVPNKKKAENKRDDIISQFRLYQKLCQEERLRENDDPGMWWANKQTPLLNQLVLKAKEFLVCPAVSIDAKYYFGNTGIFERLVQLSSVEKATTSLLVAEYQQHFRGRGASYNSFEPVIDAVRIFDGSLPTKKARIDVTVHSSSEEHISSNLVSNDKSDFNEELGVDLKPFDTNLTKTNNSIQIIDEWDDFVDCFSPPLEQPGPSTSQHQEFEQEDRATYQHNPQKLPRKRHCAMCGKFEVGKNIKDVTMTNERLLLALGAVYRKDMKLEDANSLYLKNRIVVCRVHFVETCIAIYSLLKIDKSEQITDLPNSEFEAILSLVESITVRGFSLSELRTVLHSFTTKYKELTIARIDGVTDDRTPCLCCGALGESSEMVKMPENAFEWARWMNSLGIAYADLEQSKNKNFLCHEHFPKNAFTKGGRLLMGILPKRE